MLINVNKERFYEYFISIQCLILGEMLIKNMFINIEFGMNR